MVKELFSVGDEVPYVLCFLKFYSFLRSYVFSATILIFDVQGLIFCSFYGQLLISFQILLFNVCNMFLLAEKRVPSCVKFWKWFCHKIVCLLVLTFDFFSIFSLKLLLGSILCVRNQPSYRFILS